MGAPLRALRAGAIARRFRLFSDADVARVLAMRNQLSLGLSAAEAARAVLNEGVDEAVSADRDIGAVLDEPFRELRSSLRASTRSALMRPSTGCSRPSVSNRFSVRWCCRSSGARRRLERRGHRRAGALRKQPPPRTPLRAGPRVGRGSGSTLCSRLLPVISTISGSSSSLSRFATAAGASRFSAPTRRSRRSSTPLAASLPRSSCSRRSFHPRTPRE